MFINYFFSTWIANLGVVPLFSLAFFLSLPVFFSLFFLLILVCLVREPILKSFILEYIKLFRKEYLTFLILIVKVISLPHAHANHLKTTNTVIKEVFLAKGEQLEIQAPGLKTFSIGNKEVIRHSHRKAQEIIIIKGSIIGFSDLVIWNTNNTKITYRIYVTSKKEQLAKMELLSSLKETGLEITMSGQLSYVTGEVKSLKEYFILQNLKHLKVESLFINVAFNSDLRNKLYQKIYNDFSNLGGENIYCQTSQIDIDCFYLDPNSLVDIKKIEQTYQIKMHNLFDQLLHRNFHLKFTFYTMESNKIETLASGLDQFKASLSKLISTSRLKLETTDIFAQNRDVDIKFSATQKLKVLVGKKFDLKIGTEVPFRNQVQGETITEWRFSGLRIRGELKPFGNRITLNYNSEISAPTEQGISGPSGKSSIVLDSEKAQVLFHLEFGGKNNLMQGIPGLEKIPLFGRVFESSSQSHSHKIVICVVEQVAI